MSRVRIDFAPAARWRPGIAVGLSALALIAASGFAARIAWQRDAQLQALHARLAERAPAPQPVVRIAPPSHEQAEAVNAAITLLNLPWPALLDGLNAARPKDVAVLRIEPRASQRSLRVVAESERADALFDFADALAHQPPFVRLKPVSQVRLDSPARVQATMDLEWQP